jgi:hypothetical protein
MKGLGDWIHSQETYPGSGQYMKYGLYSCRGTCQCGSSYYSGPGGLGYEVVDTDWMVKYAGCDWLKVSSYIMKNKNSINLLMGGAWCHGGLTTDRRFSLPTPVEISSSVFFSARDYPESTSLLSVNTV